MKAMKVLYIVLFMSVCIFFSAGTVISGGKSDTSENRQLSGFPELYTDDNTLNINWFEEFDTYFSEHFFLRSNLVNINSIIQAEVFKTSAEDDVIIGKFDWLYYADTVDDFTGRNVLSDKTIDNISRTVSLMEEYCENNGSRFIFTIAPNKNSIYPNNMPYYYIESSSENNFSKLHSKLYDENVSCCNLADVFKNSNSLLYHKTDTHWNNRGALLAYNTLLDYAGIEHYTYSDTAYNRQLIWSGDLYEMLYPLSDKKDEQIVYDTDFNFEYTSKFKSVDDLTITTYNSQGTGSLLMFRDSFGRALYPFMSQHFENAKYSRSVPYKLNTLEENSVDLVILEIVERNIPDLAKTAPFMPAPERSIPENAVIAENSQIYTKEVNGYIKIYGELETSAENGIYVKTGGRVYEAFPIYESKLLTEDEDIISDNGFSMIILPEYYSDDITVYVN